MTDKKIQWRHRLAYAAVALACVVVILGAFTRLVDAGLGCPDWPGCYGHLMWPDSESEVAAAEAKFPEAPVEHDKTWPEMVHRYFAGALGVLILINCILSVGLYRRLPRGPGKDAAPLKLPIFLVALVVVQAAFGMWTVTLKLWPQVVTAHLMGGFATLSLLWLMVLRTGGRPWQPPHKTWALLQGLRIPALAVLCLVLVQIALGGWTSSNYAALACPDLPTCHGVWWPPADFSAGFNVAQDVGPNYLGGRLDNHARTAIHFSHRLGALVVSLAVVFMAALLWRTSYNGARRLAGVLVAVLVVQVCLGLSNVYWVLPLWVAVAHNAVGAALLLVMVTINHRLRTVELEKES